MKAKPTPASPDPAQPVDLRTPEAMLETIHLAYRHILDNALSGFDTSGRPNRLTYEEQWELGRRLVQYWFIKSPPNTNDRSS